MRRAALFTKGNRVFADSRDVAECFGKRHDNVIKALRNILDTDVEAALNFGASAYRDPTGRSLVHFLMDRDGFMQAVVGFTGAEAICWRRATSKLKSL